MKILVISLLRIGDLVTHSGLIWNLKKQYPNANIDLLINDTSQKIIPLMPYVNHWWTFNRKKIQNLVLNKEHSFFEPYDILQKEILNELTSAKYDLIINLTQNRLSAHLAGLIPSPQKLGLHSMGPGQFGFGHPWFQYLNHQNHLPNSYHYIDIFKFALGQFHLESKVKLLETNRGILEAEDLLFSMNPDRSKIVIQPFTSDPRKDWPFFKNYISKLKKFTLDTEFILLGAEFEREKITELKMQIENEGTKVHVCICSLEGAYSILKRSQALVTVDTSIKHMASSTKCKIIELSLGPSVYQNTGVYNEGSLIVSPKVNCYPCEHRGSCIQEQFICQNVIDPHFLVEVTQAYLDNDKRELILLAHQHRKNVRVLETHFSTNNRWFTKELEVFEPSQRKEPKKWQM